MLLHQAMQINIGIYKIFYIFFWLYIFSLIKILISKNSINNVAIKKPIIKILWWIAKYAIYTTIATRYTITNICHFLAELSEIIFSFTFSFPFNNSSKLKFNSSLITIRLSISSMPLSFSHFVTACRDTFNFSANYSCESPSWFLYSFNLSPNLIFQPSFNSCR